MAAPKCGVCLITRCDPCVHPWSLGVHFAVCTMVVLYGVHNVMCMEKCATSHTSVCFIDASSVRRVPQSTLCSVLLWWTSLHFAVYTMDAPMQWSACAPLLGVQCAPMMPKSTFCSVHYGCTNGRRVPHYQVWSPCAVTPSSHQWSHRNIHSHRPRQSLSHNPHNHYPLSPNHRNHYLTIISLAHT